LFRQDLQQGGHTVQRCGGTVPQANLQGAGCWQVVTATADCWQVVTGERQASGKL
jgi:hypothetical protein